MEYGTNRLLKHGAILALDAKDIIDKIPELKYEERKEKNVMNEKIVPTQYLEIYRLIKKKKMNSNMLCRSLNKPINEVNSLLFMMELEGFVKRLPSNEYDIKGE